MIEVFGHQVPTELREIIEPSVTAFLIIDMQNDWCSPGGASDLAGGDVSVYSATIPRIRRFAEHCRDIGVAVVNVRMGTLEAGKSDSPAWLRLRLRANRYYRAENDSVLDFTLSDSWGMDFVHMLEPKPGDVVVTKYRSSALYATGLDLLLRTRGITTAIVAGATTEGCVESTVRDLSTHDYIPVVLADCVASNVPELHEASLFVMGAYRADIATSDEVLAIWRGTGSPDEVAVAPGGGSG